MLEVEVGSICHLPTPDLLPGPQGMKNSRVPNFVPLVEAASSSQELQPIREAGERSYVLGWSVAFCSLSSNSLEWLELRGPPITEANAMTSVLLSWIQDVISLPTVAPLHSPLLHLPPAPHDVPSRKFCCME